MSVPFASVVLEDSKSGVSANLSGIYEIQTSYLGNQNIIITAIGMITKEIYVDIDKGLNIIDITLDAVGANSKAGRSRTGIHLAQETSSTVWMSMSLEPRGFNRHTK